MGIPRLSLMSLRTRLLILLAVILAGLSLGTIVGPANAESWGSQSNCPGTYHLPMETGSMDWGFFPGHDIVTDVQLCYQQDGPSTDRTLSWVAQPHLTLPCASGAGWALCPTETVSVVSAPHIVAYKYEYGGVEQLTYKFAIKQCPTATLGVLMCSTFAYKLWINPFNFHEKCVSGGTNNGQTDWYYF